MKMIGKILCALVTAQSLTAAELHPIIDAQTGFLLGASRDGKWIKAEAVGKELPSSLELHLFDLSGKIGRAKSGKAVADQDVCPDIFVVPLEPPAERPGIAVAASSNPLPRKPRLADLTQQVYIDATRAFLESRGLKKPTVKIEQIIRIDLEGDGEEEVLISATNYLKDGDGMLSSAKAGDYSCVFLRRVVKGEVRTQFVAGEFYPKAKTFNAPNEYKIGAILDLNGDGVMEVVVDSAYYEGGTTSVYTCTEKKVTEVLSAGCGV